MILFRTSLFIGLITFSWNIFPAVAAGGGGLVTLCVRFCIKRHGRKRLLRALAALIFSLILAWGSVWRKLHRSYSSHIPAGRGAYIGTGQIVENHGKGRYLLRTEKYDDILYYSAVSYELGESLFVTAFSDIPSALTGLFSLHSEAISRFATKVEQLQNADRERGFEKEKWLLMKGLAGALYESRAVPIHSSAGEGWLLTLRSALHHSITSLLPDRQTAGLTLGMLIGDRSYLSAETYDTFVQSGLVHIIAVSGGNIVLIVSLLSALLFFLPFYIRLAAVAAAVLIYALLCGFDSSVIRATTMALLSIGALFFGRWIDIWRSIRYTYMAMILRNPYLLLYDLGFIFSFSALAGLVYFSQRRQLKVTKKIFHTSVLTTLKQLRWRLRNLSLLPSMAASTGIFPTLMFFTGSVNVLSIVSNLLVLPVVPFVMIYGFFISFLYKWIPRWGFALPQQRAVDRIYAVNKRGVEHALMLTINQWRARLVIIVLTIIVIISLIKRPHKRMV